MDCVAIGGFRAALGFGKRWGGVVFDWEGLVLEDADAAERRGVGLE